MNTVREFTDSDWMGCAGAEGWGQHIPGTGYEQQPLAVEISDKWYVTADHRSVLACNEDGDCWEVCIPFPTQSCARAFLAGLPADFEPADFGFEQY